MVPKLHKKGASFKGAAIYLLHDKGRAVSSDRVVWTQARNVAVNDPELIWRIMAATSMDQDRLKSSAGIKSTGRKSSTPVLHLTLAWHPEEKGALTQHDMKLAVSGAIEALGAENHQSLIIAHNDEAHPHVHILINRVHPEDGRMLSSSKEKLNLSQWAERYEHERGKVYCEERVANNEARESGKYVCGTKEQYRRIFDELSARSKLSNDNRDIASEVRKRQKATDSALSKKGRALEDKQRREWQALNEKIKSDKSKSVERAREVSARMASRIRDAYRPAWDELYSRHKAEREQFEIRERKLIGRIHNSIDAIRLSYSKGRNDKGGKVGDLFSVVATKGARERAVFKVQELASRALRQDQKNKELEVKARIKEVARLQKLRFGIEFLAKRKGLIAAQANERSQLQAQWRERHTERRLDWYNMERKKGPQEKVKSDFSVAAEGINAKKEALKERIKQRLRDERDKDKSRDGR